MFNNSDAVAAGVLTSQQRRADGTASDDRHGQWSPLSA
jgi:hypothetical protein